MVTVYTVIKAVSKMLCAEILRAESAEKRKTERFGSGMQRIMQRKGATDTTFKKIYSEDSREYKAVMRLTPAQVEILLKLISRMFSSEVLRESVF